MKRAGVGAGSSRWRWVAGLATRRLVGCVTVVVVCVAALVGVPAVVSADASSLASVNGSGASSYLMSPATGGSGASSSSSVLGSLVVPGVQTLDGGQQMQAARQAELASPSAVTARERSRTEFEHLGAAGAARVAREAFPEVIDRPAGGPPELSVGTRIARYVAPNAAQLELPGGKHGVIESIEPMAMASSPGHYTPLDLGLTQAGDGYVPAASDVGVQIPKRLSDGVQLPGNGVSLTPIDAQGRPLSGEGEGSLDGAAVMYANTQADTDTLAKPTATGFEVDDVLRSIDSPRALYFRVGLPAGAHLVQHGSDTVYVVEDGQAIATVPAPSAQDAAGTAVPVSMRGSGDVLRLKVSAHAREYQYPIEVDPEVVDKELLVYDTNWRSVSGGKLFGYYNREESAWVEAVGDFDVNEWVSMMYPTEGKSHIVAFYSETSASDVAAIENRVGIAYSNGEKGVWEGVETLPSSYGATGHTVDATGSSDANIAEYVQNAVNSEVSGKVSENSMMKASVTITQSEGPSVKFNTTSPKTKAGKSNVLYTKGWLGPETGYEAEASDPGLGISEWTLSSAWGSAEYLGECTGAQCSETANGEFDGPPYDGNLKLPDGEDSVEVKVSDGVGLTASAVSPKMKVDGTPPHSIELAGLPASGVLSEPEYHLAASATDGTAPVESSGVGSISVSVEGREIGKAQGTCSPGPCTAGGEWVLKSNEFSAGEHKLTVKAVDNVGNTSSETYTFFVHQPQSVSFGPGSVNPQTGELTVSTTDVSVAAAASELTVGRTYRSRHLTAGTGGPLGPLWELNVGDQETITKLSNGNVTLNSASGGEVLFVGGGGEAFTSPHGDANLVLTSAKNSKGELTEYTLKDTADGGLKHFTSTTGSGASTWNVTAQEGPLSSQTVHYSYQTVEGITEPVQELAPVPAGVSCSSSLVKGCRALTFTYATATTATGEGSSEWGNYKGLLKEISFTAYEPATKAMKTVAIASYLYDNHGYLRAEWNPRVSPSQKTIYGYDKEGHLVSVRGPGMQPSLVRYGTTASDTGAGRILSVTRPAASTSMSETAAPSATGTAPTLSSTSPVIGTTLKVATNGEWTNPSLSYAYSWEDCYTVESKETCQAIPGADNQSYTPQASDAGYTLKAQVTAFNAIGTGTASTAASKAVVVAAPEYKRQWGSAGETEGEFKGPVSAAIDSSGDVWVVDYNNSRVQEFSSTGTFIRAIGWGVSNGEHKFENCTGSCKAGIAGAEPGEFGKPEGIAINQATGNVYVVDKGNNRVQEFGSKGEYVRTFGASGSKAGQFNTPTGIAITPNTGDLWVADTLNDRVEEFTPEGGYLTSFGGAGTGNGQFSDPDGIAFSSGNAYVVDTGNDRVQEFSMGGEFIRAFGSKGTTEGEFEKPYGITTEPHSGDLYVGDYGNDRIEEFNPAGIVVSAFGKKGSGNGEFVNPEGVAVNAAGDVYVPDVGNNRVQELEPKYSTNDPAPEPPVLGTSVISTIEYGVPLSGTGLPTMTKSEVEKWGQTDDPATAVAIFPPDEPMGWPAKEYKRATITYKDELGHTVNVSSPTGGISTSEYNHYNDVIRTLSPDNRAAALAEGSKSAEVAKLLSSESKYNGEKEGEKVSEPGTQLLETLGPEHSVKLSTGTVVKARDHVHNYYNEGAPEGETYNLVTKSTDGAQYEGKEADIRETVTSYAGIGNEAALGWTLRKPMSVTTDPNGLKLVHANNYEPSTGSLIETQMPEGVQTHPREIPSYKEEFSAPYEPNGVTLNTAGDLWVSHDAEKKVVDEYGETGTLLKSFGAYGSKGDTWTTPDGIAFNGLNGNLYIANEGGFEGEECYSSICEFTPEGKEEGEFATKTNVAGVTTDSSGDVWVTGKEGTYPVKEYSRTGTLLKSIGEKGAGKNQLESPDGIVVYEGDVFVTDSSNDKVVEYTTGGTVVREFGSKGKEPGEFTEPKDMAVEPSSGTLYVVDSGNNRVEEFNTSGTYLGDFGSSGKETGQFSKPTGIAVNPSSGRIYVVDTGNSRIDVWTLALPKSAHNSQIVYYTTAANGTIPACGEHPEWANLPCQNQPAAQPTTSPKLPVSVTTYNMWDEPTTTTETLEGGARTKTTTYEDEGSRVKSAAVSSTAGGTALPTVTDEYNSTTGALEKQSTTTESKTKTITSVYNSLGELTSYTDADGNVASYEYDIDGRTTKINDGKGTQTYTYNTTTGELTELVDSSASGMKFTGSYDTEGNLLTEGYPNGMTATYKYNSVGAPVELEYKKTTHCTEKCTWFSDAVVPSIHGQWLEQTSTLSHQAYTYDAAGRLTQVQNTPASTGDCTTRVYAYNEDTDRTSLTTFAPGSKGECTSTGGTAENHTYDEADRLTDTGVSYNALGDTTKLPASDAGGSELLSTYYTDNQAASQEQNGQTVGYELDPAGRVRETVLTGKKVADVVNHYAGPGNSPAWTVNMSGEWTRNIPGIGGGLAAIQNNGETPVLQITNLHGDIIATAALSETATALTSTADTSEFGVPTVSAPPKYSWLGSIELPTELPSGIMTMGVRSYVPQLGRFLQPDPVPGGSANAYAYTFGDPVNSSDPTGEFAVATPSWAIAFNDEQAVLATEAVMRRIEEEEAAREAAEEAQKQAEEAAQYAGPQYEEEGEEYEEEEEGYEEVSYHHRSRPESEEWHVESGVLVQPLNGEEAGNGKGGATLGSTVPLCKAGVEGPCASDTSRRRRTYTLCPRWSPVEARPSPVEARPGTPGDTRNRSASDPSAEQLFSAALVTSIEHQVDEKYPPGPGDESHYDRGSPSDYDDEDGE
jgi:RHS repeat-associated protein